jgi:hypothetical protein
VGFLRCLPAEPKRKEGQMKYKIEISFDCSKELSIDELAQLENNLILQVEEPTDYDSNNCDWKSLFVATKLEKL